MMIDVHHLICRAIGGNGPAIDLLIKESASTGSTLLLVMAAVLRHDAELLGLARQFATTTRDRQLVAIARSFLADDTALVDALARDHLVDYPDSLIVAWLAAGATKHNPPTSFS
jgi:hypothetical protein